MRKIIFFIAIILASNTLILAQQRPQEPARQHLRWNSFSHKHSHLTFFYNTIGFQKENFLDGGRYGVGYEFTTNAYIGGIIRESMDFGLQQGFALDQVKPGYEGEKKWYLSTEVGPSINFFATDHIAICVPFLWSFRYGGNANEFYDLQDKTLFGKEVSYHMAYVMTPTVNIYLSKLVLNIGVNFEFVPKAVDNKVTNLGLHVGLGFGR